MTTVVLGWDGLDYQLVNNFGLADLFGKYNKNIDTFDNEELGKPHTMELWPSMITGLKPFEHGFRPPNVDNSRASWENDRIDMISRIAQSLLPKPIRSFVGSRLRDTGAELDKGAHASEYQENGIETVFDGRKSLPINIPNYATEFDDYYQVALSRTGPLSEYINIEQENGTRTFTPNIPLPELEIRLAKWLSIKLGIVETSIYRDYDLIFVWLSHIDTIGHLAPLTQSGWQERAYNRAAQKTQFINESLGEEDTLVCVSDHGLQNGKHTHNAFLSSTDEVVLNETQSVIDLRSALDSVTPSSGNLIGLNDYPDIRSEFRYENSSDRQTADQIHAQLEELGYLS